MTAAADRVRPVVWTAVRSAPVYPLLREWDNARHTACETVQRAALWLAALLMLATITPGDAR